MCIPRKKTHQKIQNEKKWTQSLQMLFANSKLKNIFPDILNGFSNMTQFRFHAWALQRALLKEGRAGLARYTKFTLVWILSTFFSKELLWPLKKLIVSFLNTKDNWFSCWSLLGWHFNWRSAQQQHCHVDSKRDNDKDYELSIGEWGVGTLCALLEIYNCCSVMVTQREKH